jgi:hypothetical protein
VADFCSYGPSGNKLNGFSQKSKIIRCFEEAHSVPHGKSVGHYTSLLQIINIIINISYLSLSLPVAREGRPLSLMMYLF